MHTPTSGALTFKWDAFDAHLSLVDQQYKDPKFYSLKRVVEILSAADPQRLVRELREQQEILDTLVDRVVHSYHSGFARSLQSYSQILQLFSESKSQVHSLKKSLSDASRQLSTQSGQLRVQWRKGISYSSSLALLEDIQSVVNSAAAIHKMISVKNWRHAVDLLMTSCGKLARTETMQVEGLRKLRTEMGDLSLQIKSKVADEVESRIFSQHGTSTSSPKKAHSRRKANGLDGATRKVHVSPKVSGGRFSAVSANEILEQVSELSTVSQYAQSRPTSLPELVDCLRKMDALEEVKQMLRLHIRPQV